MRPGERGPSEANCHAWTSDAQVSDPLEWLADHLPGLPDSEAANPRDLEDGTPTETAARSTWVPAQQLSRANWHAYLAWQVVSSVPASCKRSSHEEFQIDFPRRSPRDRHGDLWGPLEKGDLDSTSPYGDGQTDRI